MKIDATDWFAGFADGESCFAIGSSGRPGGFRPIFVITLRADDLAILEALRERFGGGVYHRSLIGTAGTNPGYHWQVFNKRDLRQLVEYFDAHPLRTRKAHDYAIWRRAVLAYCQVGHRAPELHALNLALKESHRFEASEAELPTSAEIYSQLGLED